MADKEGIRRFFTREEEDLIVDAIRAAELNTSGEIRVHIEERCKGDAFKRATKVFHQLKMDATELRNGILFYIAQTDHKFSIIGDKGINDKVPGDFWDHIRDEMQTLFRQGAYANGLVKGIEATGKALKEFFPYQKNEDVNELPDDISHG
jgi:uncharacterized membrane protein